MKRNINLSVVTVVIVLSFLPLGVGAETQYAVPALPNYARQVSSCPISSIQLVTPTSSQSFNLGDTIHITWKTENVDPSQNLSIDIVGTNKDTSYFTGGNLFVQNSAGVYDYSLPKNGFVKPVKLAVQLSYITPDYKCRIKGFSDYFYVNPSLKEQAFLSGLNKPIINPQVVQQISVYNPDSLSGSVGGTITLNGTSFTNFTRVTMYTKAGKGKSNGFANLRTHLGNDGTLSFVVPQNLRGQETEQFGSYSVPITPGDYYIRLTDFSTRVDGKVKVKSSKPYIIKVVSN